MYDFWLEVGLLFLSILNAMTVVWLGITVLMNTKRRNWGVWVMGTGLLLAGGFFFVYAGFAGLSVEILFRTFTNYWYGVWVVTLLVPVVWYLLTLWYSGMLEGGFRGLSVSQQVNFLVTILTSIVLIGLGGSLSTGLYGQVELLITFLLVVHQGINSFGSVGVLRKAGGGDSVMGTLARKRAMPWLVAATLLQGIGVMMVGGLVILYRSSGIDSGYHWVFVLFNLVILTVILIVSLMVGQSVVNYEIFTGKSLPSRGLRRHWRRMLFLSTGLAITLSIGVVIEIPPIYLILVTIGVTVAFLALINWRMYVERERFILQLRPFVSSDQIYRNVVHETNTEVDLTEPFVALCKDILEVNLAYLIPTGPLSNILETHYVYPVNLDYKDSWQEELSYHVGQDEICVSVDPEKYGGAVFLAPLYDDQGESGLLLLGPRKNGALFMVEEIEIARMVCERLIDTQVSAALAKRVMALRTHHLAESQMVDHRSRRTIHDEILPQLHSILIVMDPMTRSEEIQAISAVHKSLSQLLLNMPESTTPSFAQLGLVEALKRLVEDYYRVAFQKVEWILSNEYSVWASEIPNLYKEILYYAAREVIRNSVKYGKVEDRPFVLTVKSEARNGYSFIIRDNGVGVAHSDIQDGRGLMVHSTMMEIIGGRLMIRSKAGEFSEVELWMPDREMRL